MDSSQVFLVLTESFQPYLPFPLGSGISKAVLHHKGESGIARAHHLESKKKANLTEGKRKRWRETKSQ